MRRRRSCSQLALLVASLLWAAPATAGQWHSAQPLPPPGDQQTTLGVPVPLGHVGDIEFWAPNRGLLITAGNEAIPAGLYYYNGVSWRELSTVCGGSNGRIAWAGADDFWTISDQQVGQQTGPADGEDRSLCHFQNGQVVASYAEPLGVAGSYQPMDAATCASASDCWFGGESLPAGLNNGAFHLHWNGTTVTPVPSLATLEPQLEDPSHPVVSMASYKGRVYESVRVQPGGYSPSENPSQPFLVHSIVEGASHPFAPKVIEGVEGAFTYGGVEPTQMPALRFTADAADLWAIVGPSSAAASVQPIVVKLNATTNQFQQLAIEDPLHVFSIANLGGFPEIGGQAAEPGTHRAWVSIDLAGESSGHVAARVAPVGADGTVGAEEQLPEAGEHLGAKGSAGPISCPTQGDCWLATSDGWLFHMGGSYPEDTDPNFQSLISYRPPDASIPFVAPETFPEDDSGANPAALPSLPQPTPPVTVEKVRAPLFTHVKEHLVGRTTIAITFTLATKSSVRLLAIRRGRRVAQTDRRVLSRGRHTLALRLNPRAWPTKLDLRVQALGQVPLVTPGSGGYEAPGGPTAVSTAVRAG